MNDPQTPESGVPAQGPTPTPSSPFASPDPAEAYRAATSSAPVTGEQTTSPAGPPAPAPVAPAMSTPAVPVPAAPTAGAGAPSQPVAHPAYSSPVIGADPSTTSGATPTPVGRLRARTVAAVAVGAVVLGGLAGFGGAALHDAADDGGSGAVSTLPASDSGSNVPTSNSAPNGVDVVSIAAAVTPSVVVIEVMSNGSVVSTGSGFFIRDDGYILTNAHVVADADGTVNVVKSDGTETEGTVVGESTEYDLAVVHIDETGLTPLVLADSDAVVVGEGVVAIGSPLGLESTVTTGIVSALHRPVTTSDSSSTAFVDALQTDAAINPGNSGGPLLNADGEVIGINSAIATLSTRTDSTGSIGLGFAITSNQARRTAEELIANGVATYPVIGVMLDSRYTGEGVQVLDTSDGVVAGSPADQAGIQPGDVITAIDGRPVTQSDELVVAIRAKAPGDDVTLTVQSGDSSQDVVVTLASNDNVVFSDEGSESTENPTPDPGDE